MISEMKRSGQGQNITLTWSELNSWSNTVLWLVSKSQTMLWLAWWAFNRWILKVETNRQTDIFYKTLLNCSFAVKKSNYFLGYLYSFQQWFSESIQENIIQVNSYVYNPYTPVSSVIKDRNFNHLWAWGSYWLINTINNSYFP